MIRNHEAKNLPTIISPKDMGLVFNVSYVPDLRSSAIIRMVMAGPKNGKSQGVASNNKRKEATFSKNKLPTKYEPFNNKKMTILCSTIVLQKKFQI